MRFRHVLSLLIAATLTACAHAKPDPTAKILPPPPAPAPASPEAKPTPPAADVATVEKVEILRAQALELLYSKDPSIKNPKLAFEKFMKAAQLGDPVSMDHLGGFYSTGDAGVEKSCKKSMEWYERSAALGYPMALNNLAYTLVTCPDKKLRNPEKAEELMKTLFANTPGLLAALDTYSAVQAQDHNFKQAAQTMGVVVDLAEFTDANPEHIDEFKASLAAYKKGKILEDGDTSFLHGHKKKLKKKKLKPAAKPAAE